MSDVLSAPSSRQRSLADLQAGQEGRITALSFEAVDAASPLQLGARVYMVESGADGWRHVRIDFREYSIPVGLAERVAVATPEPAQAPPEGAAGDHYQVLISRRRQNAWLVRVVRRSDGSVVRIRRFDAEPAARAWCETLREDVALLDLDAFRERHALA